MKTNLELKIARTNSHATVLLSAPASFLHHFLDSLGSGLRKIASSHHALLLEHVLDSGSNYVTHNVWGKMVRTGGL